jgi:hypothetical protein
MERRCDVVRRPRRDEIAPTTYASWAAGGGFLSAAGAGDDDEAEGFEVGVEPEDLRRARRAVTAVVASVILVSDVAVLLEKPPGFPLDGFVDPGVTEAAGFVLSSSTRR